VVAIGASACGAPVATAPPPAPPPPIQPATPVPPFGEGAWGDFASKRFGLRIPLPNGSTWRIDDHNNSWLVAAHRLTDSELWARSWAEPGVVSRQRCEEEARLRRKLPEREGAEIVEKRALDAPAGFDTQLEVGVISPAAKGAKRKPQADAPAEGEVRAFAMAFGGKGHRCFAYVFLTRVSGPGAEPIVGERLATMVQGSLAHVTLESALDPKIPRDDPTAR
jgi:hypothetical protein